MGRKLAVAVGATLIAAVVPGPALAANVTGANGAAPGSVVYDAGNGEVNQPTVTRVGAAVVVRDPSANLTAMGTCTPVDAHAVSCPDGAVPSATVGVAINLGDGADTAVVEVPNATLHGGPGKDTLTGSDTANDALYGEGDEDTLDGRGGDDTLIDGIADAAPNHLFGGRGDDVLYGGTGADQLDGGDGFVTYADRGVDAASGVTVALVGGAASGAGAPGENDSLAAIENLQGTAKNDALGGDDGANIIQGLGGDDTITGGKGADLLYGGDGNDAIDAVDQGFDRVSCGGPQPGDTASVDDADAVAGCPGAGAGLSISPVPVPLPPDVAAPRVGVTYTKVVKAKTFRRRGATFTVFSSDKAVRNTVTAQLIGRVRSVKSFSTAAVGELELARRSAGFVGKQRLTLKPSRRYRAHLRKGQRIRLRLTVTDQARNRATKTVIIRLK
jgi:hypothetical protein